MMVTPAELADRTTILLLKQQHGQDVAAELCEYERALRPWLNGVPALHALLAALLAVNGEIWALEADIRQGKEGALGLEEVGRRALAIRDLNARRINIKNEITVHTGCGFPERKSDHASCS